MPKRCVDSARKKKKLRCQPPHLPPSGCAHATKITIGKRFFTFASPPPHELLPIQRLEASVRDEDVDRVADALLLFQGESHTEDNKAHVSTCKGGGKLSLTLLNFFATDYLELHPSLVSVDVSQGATAPVLMDAAAALRRFKKCVGETNVGAFRDGARFVFSSKGRELNTATAPFNLLLFLTRHGLMKRFVDELDRVRAEHHRFSAPARRARVIRDRRKRKAAQGPDEGRAEGKEATGESCANKVRNGGEGEGKGEGEGRNGDETGEKEAETAATLRKRLRRARERKATIGFGGGIRKGTVIRVCVDAPEGIVMGAVDEDDDEDVVMEGHGEHEADSDGSYDSDNMDAWG